MCPWTATSSKVGAELNCCKHVPAEEGAGTCGCVQLYLSRSRFGQSSLGATGSRMCYPLLAHWHHLLLLMCMHCKGLQTHSDPAPSG
jgi:hypothetical protein